ncbi:nuclease associated modular domain 3 protein [Vibrio phage 2.275.O._10N.286.54.E11]|nr:nuclease associated modular domain 3 protein [Vibrio phage 2.275.O._10N.286.54.E11]
MDPKQEYNKLMQSAATRGWTKSTAPCYIEMHHILPRSLGGSDTSDNLVCLTAQEHYQAHKLLYEYTIGRDKKKMAHAWFLLSHRDGIQLTEDEYADAKQALIEAKTGTKHTLEARAKMSASRTGQRLSAEHRRKISESNMGRIQSSETRQKIREAATGRTHSEETKKKISMNTLGKEMPVYAKDAIGVAVSKQRNSEEDRYCVHCDKFVGSRAYARYHGDNCLEQTNLSEEKLTELKKKRSHAPLTEEHRRKVSEAGKGRKHSDEAKAKMREAIKKSRPQVTCPYCNKEGPRPSMIRWHFDNCKFKPD